MQFIYGGILWILESKLPVSSLDDEAGYIGNNKFQVKNDKTVI